MYFTDFYTNPGEIVFVKIRLSHSDHLKSEPLYPIGLPSFKARHGVETAANYKWSIHQKDSSSLQCPKFRLNTVPD
ncbi:hypothetical protein SINU_11730 [Sporolactobacillus inulinus CASD]|uniref:Uncharacterized protein n=1 Tax=Sporolactobacillus inulinus CASD TaxID=1069536 RepID=A0A0U1QLQ5_9BACL|nr:hypothetical protein SINU_11730 [Sporolactobacillus inulinus CASD]GEB78338.1 hypothetical protein SIN01_26830 [Sporolactobacillus inulinus]